MIANSPAAVVLLRRNRLPGKTVETLRMARGAGTPAPSGYFIAAVKKLFGFAGPAGASGGLAGKPDLDTRSAA
jgi:hypothetical protein